ncbi:MAG: site-2 protease family protein [Phycisphaeraceae bacterium]|nr:site-2 protease family protein [Phycisphaeraceae bacterium]
MTFFIQHALEPETQLFYVSVVVAVMISIILHELAHGFVAIRLGDDTPRHLGHMTIDPVTHMGPLSIGVLFLMGLAWGQMPVDESRMRGRHAGALVAVAGPLTNLLLAILALSTMAILINVWHDPRSPFEPMSWAEAMSHRGDQDTLTPFQSNSLFVLGIFGSINLLLTIFNLIPVPPLDGSRILANYHHHYRQFIEDPEKQQMLMLGFFLAFIVISRLRQTIFAVSAWWVDLLGTVIQKII